MDKNTDRLLPTETVEGEIALVIDYKPGQSVAIDVLQAAMDLIQALDGLDKILLSSVDTSLEPVSVLNDVQHSSLKMLLARHLRKVPDKLLETLDWRKWAGSLLVAGKYKLLGLLEAQPAELSDALQELAPYYKDAPALLGYDPPSTQDVRIALDKVSKARALLPGQSVTVQTELGDVILAESGSIALANIIPVQVSQTRVNRGNEFFKVKSPDLLGQSQWDVLRNGRKVAVSILDGDWLEAYHARKHSVLPGDSLE